MEVGWWWNGREEREGNEMRRFLGRYVVRYFGGGGKDFWMK